MALTRCYRREKVTRSEFQAPCRTVDSSRKSQSVPQSKFSSRWTRNLHPNLPNSHSNRPRRRRVCLYTIPSHRWPSRHSKEGSFQTALAATTTHYSKSACSLDHRQPCRTSSSDTRENRFRYRRRMCISKSVDPTRHSTTAQRDHPLSTAIQVVVLGHDTTLSPTPFPWPSPHPVPHASGSMTPRDSQVPSDH